MPSADQVPTKLSHSTMLWARVGCPDRRIDRLCITCCSPSQPSHHAGCPARSRLRRKRDGFLVSLALDHHSPDHSRELVGKATTLVGRAMLGAMDPGVTDVDGA